MITNVLRKPIVMVFRIPLNAVNELRTLEFDYTLMVFKSNVLQFERHDRFQ